MKNFTPIVTTNAKLTRFQENPAYAEGLYDLSHQIYAWLVPNGSWGESNAGLIVGKHESLLIDTLWDVPLTRTMLAVMDQFMKSAPIRRVVNTHADGDHCWGNELLASAEIIASAASAEEMRADKPQKLIFFGLLGRIMSILALGDLGKVGHWFMGMVKPYDFGSVHATLPTRTFECALTLDFEGRTIELMQVGPAHTHGDTIVYIPDAKTLFTGDILFVGSTPVMWAGPVKNWLDALDRILKLDVDTIIPGHGPITDKDGVRQIKDYWEFLDRHVRKCFQQGLSPRRAAYQIVMHDEFNKKPFAKWNSPERIMTNTHIMYRHLQGHMEHLKPPELLMIMWQQALLAHDLPHAQPAVMRKNH